MKTKIENAAIVIDQQNRAVKFFPENTKVFPYKRGETVFIGELLSSMAKDGWEQTDTAFDGKSGNTAFKFMKEFVIPPTREAVMLELLSELRENPLSNDLTPMLERICDLFGIQQGQYDATKLIRILSYALDLPSQDDPNGRL